MTYPPPPYADAVCGTPVCGEAITGKWWAYPGRGVLTLNGRAVAIIVTAAGLVVVAAARGTLTLNGRQVAYAITSRIGVNRGVLTLNGRTARFTGQQWLYQAVCQPINLAESSCEDISLAPLASR
jgi:hypothetical protein